MVMCPNQMNGLLVDAWDKSKEVKKKHSTAIVLYVHIVCMVHNIIIYGRENKSQKYSKCLQLTNNTFSRKITKSDMV